jgi:putative photosynthetic complex assembly protein 2
MSELWQPFAFATLVWWISTGLILLLDKRAVSIRVTLFFSGLLALGSLYCLTHINLIDTPSAAYAGFFCAILVWAWVEVSFLSGLVTGPMKHALPVGATSQRRFTAAVGAVLYHELMIAFAGVLVLWVSLGRPNKVALWTFLVLWVMRTSAKLNLFLGVRNLGTEMLPKHMAYLGSFFRVRKMNWLFPFSVLGSLGATIAMIYYALNANAGSATTTGVLLAASLLVLAMIEHWFMVLPIKPSALWTWAARKDDQHE